MSYYRRFIMVLCVFFSSCASAIDFSLDALYWRATEPIDWVLNNNLNSTKQEISYKTINFDFKPGFRAGVGFSNTWDYRAYYTRYYTKASSSATGNLTSTFLGGKLAQGSNFYRSGQVQFTVNFNMLDLDMSKAFTPAEGLVLRPIIGLRGGWIYQDVNTSFQGVVSINEYVKNDFSGVGPKIGIESSWLFYRNNQARYSILANFTTSYLWGKWKISDTVYRNATTINTIVGSRNLGALTVQGLMGICIEYKPLTLKLGYEISDWFDQYQVLDDGTGAHNNDLILQGITLALVYKL